MKEADESYYVGESKVSESYLNMKRIIEITRESGAEAIHPGYGLLSENAEFARRCHEEGIAFIGPSPEVISKMGSKIVARKLMEQAGVPVVPGIASSFSRCGRSMRSCDKNRLSHHVEGICWRRRDWNADCAE